MSLSRLLFDHAISIACALLCRLRQAAASPRQPPANAPVTRAELPALVKKALLDNPDMIMDAVQETSRQASSGKGQRHAKEGAG